MLSPPHLWGASQEDWTHFDLILGLGNDLLPVVSNPTANISPNSKMKGLGKTPSRYNGKREVAGITNWTTKQTTAAEIALWSKETDYGICLQTREVRALDIDVTDPELVRDIVEFIGGELQWLGLPCRSRSNSSKCLLAFKLKGEFAKRVLKVKSGIIEFLANGQQFIAIGAHFRPDGKPSGARYEWDWCEHDSFPELGKDEFEKLWAALAQEFGIAEASEGVLRKPKGTVAAGVIHDPVATYLADTGRVLDTGKESQLFIDCPFAEDHTADNGETSTAYFPAGTRGYEQGHFVCLHAHCEDRSDAEFLDGIGYRVADFEALPAPQKLQPSFLGRDKRKDGKIPAVVENVLRALRNASYCGWKIAYDNFFSEVMRTPEDEPNAWRALKDEDYTELRAHLDKRGFMPVSGEMMRDCVWAVAQENAFDTAITWIKSLSWDGTPRVESFLRDCFGAEDNAYTRSVSLYMWTAMAGRVLDPGCKADMAPILVGLQGLGKSQGVSAIAPARQYFGEIDLTDRDADLSRLLRGKLVVELSELRGLSSRDMESTKSFMSRTDEEWVPKYMEKARKAPRRFIFIGTTNQDEFLADATGERRWLPVRVGKVEVDRIAADRPQLWAEARELFELFGIAWRDAEKLAENEHSKYKISDAWEGVISEWLDMPEFGSGKKPRERDFLQVHEILCGALGFTAKNIQHRDKLRIGNVLRGMGFVKTVKRVNGELAKVWCYPCYPSVTHV